MIMRAETSPKTDKACGLCSIHAERPAFCRGWPWADSWRPLSCTYSFEADGARTGECDSSACGVLNCCNVRRLGGEPEGKVDDAGTACKHLVGLEGKPCPPHARVTMSALWSGDLHVERLDGERWSLGKVEDGEVVWDVEIPDETLRPHIEFGGAFQVRFAPPGREPISAVLDQEQLAALGRLHPKER